MNVLRNKGFTWSEVENKSIYRGEVENKSKYRGEVDNKSKYRFGLEILFVVYAYPKRVTDQCVMMINARSYIFNLYLKSCELGEDVAISIHVS